MITVGVIGYGYWGPNIVRNFAELLPDARVTRVADLHAERLTRVAARYPSIQVGTDQTDIISEASVDAVVIATPVQTHFDMGVAALCAGKHVWMEKPLAATSDQAAMWSRQVEMIKLLDREGVIHDGEERASLTCLAVDLEIDDVVEYLAADGPSRCEAGEALARVTARTATVGPGK